MKAGDRAWLLSDPPANRRLEWVELIEELRVWDDGWEKWVVRIRGVGPNFDRMIRTSELIEPPAQIVS